MVWAGPDFPAREDVWSDGANWQFGHWLNGRTADGTSCKRSLTRMSSWLLTTEFRVIDGYRDDGVSTLALALTPLSLAYDFNVRESATGLAAVPNAVGSTIEISNQNLLQDGQKETLSLLNAAPTGMILNYISGDFSYLPATAQFRSSSAGRPTMIHDGRAGGPLV